MSDKAALATTTALASTVPAPAPAAPPAASPAAPLPDNPASQPEALPAARSGDDWADQALREAEQSRAKPPAPAPAPTPAAAPPQPAAVAPAADPGAAPPARQRGGGGRPQMVPLAVVDDLRAEVRGLRQQLVEALAAPPAAPSKPAQPPQPSYQERKMLRDEEVKHLNAGLLDLAKDYDEGKFESLHALESTRQPILNRITALQMQDLAEYLLERMPKPAAQNQGLADQVFLERQIAELQEQHPWVRAMNQDQMKVLEELVETEMRVTGVVIPPGSRRVYEVRRRIAEMADARGPMWFPGWSYDPAQKRFVQNNGTGAMPAASDPPASAAPPPGPSAPPPRPATLPPVPNHPPNPNNLGTPAAGGTVAYGTEDLLTMDYEMLGALPPSRVRGAR